MENKKTFEAGQIICQEGNYELWMYEILSGKVEIYKDYGTETQEKIAEADSGYIGEMGLITCFPRSATVVAVEKTEVAIIDEEEFTFFFEKEPEKMASLILCLTERLNSLNQEYLEACKTARGCLESENEKDSALVKAMRKFSGLLR